MIFAKIIAFLQAVVNAVLTVGRTNIYNVYPLAYSHSDDLRRTAADIFFIVIAKTPVRSFHKAHITYFHTAVEIFLRDNLNAVRRIHYFQAAARVVPILCRNLLKILDNCH